MTGHIENNHALLPITFRTSARGDVVAPFIVDTGYTGFLTLPPRHIAALGLVRVDDTYIKLADGSRSKLDIYQGVIVWHGEELEVYVLEMDSDSLLGAGLMQECRVTVEFTEGGLVTVEPL